MKYLKNNAFKENHLFGPTKGRWSSEHSKITTELRKTLWTYVYKTKNRLPKCKKTTLLCIQNGMISYLPTPLLGQDMTQGQFLSRV